MKPEIGAHWIPEEEDESNIGPQSRSARPCRKAIANDESEPGTGLKVVLTHIGIYTRDLYTQPLSALTTPYMYQERKTKETVDQGEDSSPTLPVLVPLAEL